MIFCKRQIETYDESELPNGNYDNIDAAANDFWNDSLDTLADITGKSENATIFEVIQKSKRKLLIQGEKTLDDLLLTDDQRIEKQTDKICIEFRDQTWSWPNSQNMNGTDYSR